MASRGLAAAAPLPPPAEAPESPPEADDIACDEVALQEDGGVFKTFCWNMRETKCLQNNVFARWSPGEARKTYPYIVAELVWQSISRGRPDLDGCRMGGGAAVAQWKGMSETEHPPI